ITQGQLATQWPQFLAVMDQHEAIANSVYHSLQVKLDKAYSQGLYFTIAYTYSRFITDSSTGGAGLVFGDFPVQDPHNLNAERGLSITDIPHRFTGMVVYDLPIGKGRRFLNRGGVVDKVLGGWQANGLWIYESGTPMTVFNSAPNRGNRPNRICNGNLSGSQQTLNH